jgi:hypothetical protein
MSCFNVWIKNKDKSNQKYPHPFLNGSAKISAEQAPHPYLPDGEPDPFAQVPGLLFRARKTSVEMTE